MNKRRIAAIAALSLGALVAGGMLLHSSAAVSDPARSALDRELNLALAGDPGTVALADFARPASPAATDERLAPPPESEPPASEPPAPLASAPETAKPPAPVASEAAPRPEEDVPSAEPAEEPAAATEEAAPAEEARPDESEPRIETLTVPVATELRVRLDQTLNTRWNTPGDLFTATLEDPIVDGERVLVPAGTRLLGEVMEVRKPSGDEPGVLRIAFNEITVDGQSYPLEATVTTTEPTPPAPPEPPSAAGSDGGESAGSRIGRGALSGAVLGRILGRNTKGTLIGAAAGAVLGAANGSGGYGGRGPGLSAIILAAGSRVSCVLNQPLTIQRIDL